MQKSEFLFIPWPTFLSERSLTTATVQWTSPSTNAWRRKCKRVCDSCRSRLSAMKYDPLFHSRHNGRDNVRDVARKVGHEINKNSLFCIAHALSDNWNCCLKQNGGPFSSRTGYPASWAMSWVVDALQIHGMNNAVRDTVPTLNERISNLLIRHCCRHLSQRCRSGYGDKKVMHLVIHSDISADMVYSKTQTSRLTKT